MDWNLSTCGRKGHETYAPDEPALRERLHVDTPAGEAWRCLRCATYVVGPPKGSGPADHAPEVPRGALLRDRRIMRLLAAERGLRGIVLIGAAVLVFVFRNDRDRLVDVYHRDLGLLDPLADQLGWNISDSKIVRTINDVFTMSATTLMLIAFGLIVYAAIQFVESVGLWWMKRWGEYFSVIATSIFLPWEIYELTEKITWLRILLFLVNVAAVVWLIWSKRLFGARGGGRAYHAEHSSESLLTVERAAVAAESASPEGTTATPTPA